ncbi:MAG: 1-deoxy-D-xylulose-5-phosphate reductoisomerase [Candidatus Meridianibacter frigidus]|nr:MAG: 1-deoxy-D-xylulose-5-phosphate reductoisomerase [Candidatus Eremiobacteraeota bacterium]
MKRRKIAILGSTGSIGTQALEILAANPERFEVVALAGGRKIDLLAQQAAKFGVSVVSSVNDGSAGLMRVATQSGAQVVLAATDGFVAFEAIFAAVERGIDIAAANKELIVAAGELLMQRAERSGSKIIPVDSEHSAIFQCLQGESIGRVRCVVLTASGGPFWRSHPDDMARATVREALAHPTWRMGLKNTVDSASMMNKGLEVIEASRLFALPVSKIEVIVHPQSIVHGFVIFTDGNLKAQMAAPDMRLPIGYALAYPDRLASDEPQISDTLHVLGAHPEASALRYDFERPDFERFPCLHLAYEAGAKGGVAPTALSAANEVAVAAFVREEIGFSDIPRVIGKVMRELPDADLTLQSLLQADGDARDAAAKAIESEKTHAEV